MEETVVDEIYVIEDKKGIFKKVTVFILDSEIWFKMKDIEENLNYIPDQKTVDKWIGSCHAKPINFIHKPIILVDRYLLMKMAGFCRDANVGNKFLAWVNRDILARLESHAPTCKAKGPQMGEKASNEGNYHYLNETVGSKHFLVDDDEVIEAPADIVFSIPNCGNEDKVLERIIKESVGVSGDNSARMANKIEDAINKYKRYAYNIPIEIKPEAKPDDTKRLLKEKDNLIIRYEAILDMADKVMDSLIKENEILREEILHLISINSDK